MRIPPRVAVARSPAFAELDDEWSLLRDALGDVGAESGTPAWDDPAVDWGSWDVVVALYAWDYVGRRDEFLAWADGVAIRSRVVNPPAVLRWNSDKRYLADLSGDGIAIVPTAWVPPGAVWSFPDGEYVVKPTVGSGGHDAARYSSAEHRAADEHVRRLHADGRTAMVQPYQSAVDAVGETALVFVAGTYSHAVRKGPLLEVDAGVVDELWRHERIDATSPRPDQVRLAEEVLAAVASRVGPMSYARVDLLDGPGGAPLLLEAELVEPSLSLGHAPRAAGRLAAELLRQATDRP